MKQIFTSAFMMLITALTINVKAQISDKDKEDTKKVYEAATNAFKNMDATAMINIFTENGTQIDPSGKIIHGKANLLSYFTGLFSYFKSQPRPDKTTTNLSDWDGRYIVPGVILVTYVEETINSMAGKTNSTKYAFAILLVNQQGKWLTEQVAITPVINM